MNANELRSLQAPLKAHYREHPETALVTLRAEGRIGELNSRFYGVPTLRSQRLTTERDAPQILELCREDAIDAAILVPT